MLAQPFAERHICAPVAVEVEIFFHNKSAHLRLLRFDIVGVDAVIADLRVRHGDDLPGVRRIGQDLLIPGNTRVETDLSRNLPFRSEILSGEDGAVFKC